jgi:hypothetical protein
MSEQVKVVRVDPSEAQNVAAFSGAAPGVNRFVATLGATGLRVAFLEDDIMLAPHFRAAVTMHPYDGIRLYKLLQEMLKDLEPEFAQAGVSQNGGQQ